MALIGHNDSLKADLREIGVCLHTVLTRRILEVKGARYEIRHRHLRGALMSTYYALRVVRFGPVIGVAD